MKPERSHGVVALLAVLGSVVVVLVVGALLARSWISNTVSQVGGALEVDAPASTSDETVHFTVNPGESATAIATRLEEAHLIRSAFAFRMQARSTGVEGLLAAGEYDLRANMKPSEILALLSGRETAPGITVTFPEGWRMEEIADRLDARGIISRTAFLDATRQDSYSYQFLADRTQVGSLEGYLFPDTFAYAKNVTGTAVVDSMLRDFDRRLDITMRQRAQSAGLSIYQVVTLASIVEREAAVADERPIIAEVFLNRLAIGMRLQADSTVQYAVAQQSLAEARQVGYWKSELTLSDLQIDSPYNSYQHSGLPPGPICNPGLAALNAVLWPANTGYLYFVAKPDGTHAFAKTLEEHNANVARYRDLSNAR